MKAKRVVVFVVLGTLFIFTLFYHPLVKISNDSLPSIHVENDEGIELIQTKEMAFKIAKQLWVKKYGYKSLMFKVFDYRLVDDKYWVIEGCNYLFLLFKICGGGPYIVIEKSGKILSLGYTG